MPALHLVDLGWQGRPSHSHGDRLGSNETTLTVSTWSFLSPMTVFAAWLTVPPLCLLARYKRRTLRQW
jgi:hypothetical protein